MSTDFSTNLSKSINYLEGKYEGKVIKTEAERIGRAHGFVTQLKESDQTDHKLISQMSKLDRLFTDLGAIVEKKGIIDKFLNFFKKRALKKEIVATLKEAVVRAKQVGLRQEVISLRGSMLDKQLNDLKAAKEKYPVGSKQRNQIETMIANKEKQVPHYRQIENLKIKINNMREDVANLRQGPSQEKERTSLLLNIGEKTRELHKLENEAGLPRTQFDDRGLQLSGGDKKRLALHGQSDRAKEALEQHKAKFNPRSTQEEFNAWKDERDRLQHEFDIANSTVISYEKKGVELNEKYSKLEADNQAILAEQKKKADAEKLKDMKP